MRRRRHHYSSGHDRALQHIREAKELSRELGGTDEDVKRYFFGLDHVSLRRILDEYGQRFGADPKAYAEEAMPHWRSGRRHMSGLVAGRLFKLLPRYMPLSDKYRLVESLWKQYSPKSSTMVLVGPDADENAVQSAVADHLRQVVVAYRIPENLQRRFDWLTDHDASVQQDLLNRLQAMECGLIVQGLAMKLPIFLGHIRQESNHTQKLDQVIEIGHHEIRVAFDRAHVGVTVTDRPPPKPEPASTSTSSSKEDYSGCLWIIGIIVVIWLLTRK